MSPAAQKPGKGHQSGHSTPDKRTQREIARTASLVVLAILLTLFAVFNLKEVKVSYVFGTGKAPLIIVIVICVLFGIVIGYFAEHIPRKKKRH